MINIFKIGGPYKTEGGLSYDAKCIESRKFASYKAVGWVKSVNDLKEKSVEEFGVDGGSEEKAIREEIKSLGGKPGGRSSIETLKAQLKELKEANEDGED